MSRKNQKKQSVVGLVSGMVVIVLLAGAMGIALEEMAANKGDYRRTLWDWLTGKPAIPEGRAQISIQLAQELCRQRVARQMGSQLQQAAFDSRSSRYNETLQVHTVFLDLQIRNEERDIYARCDVSAVERTILEFRIQGMGGFFWG
ncbi:hypothetical protein [Saccharospirillum salsuginis]|uniref:Uncharacterized protein n=1 Tax=Saccharospirillum salsuginis TaxID=418750 RepID=A0A918K5Z8_9GAMM|nr:hypothetical protein [Saccharospirillum salsuginis]GGX51345.1 hypothetical protein GCM10007392_18250 [Saccharospirillum salsuginis]